MSQYDFTEENAEELISPLYDKLNNGEALTEYEQGIMDAILWVLDQNDKPLLD